MVAIAARAERTSFRALKRLYGVQAVYVRAGVQSAEMTVVPGNRQSTIEDADGAIMQTRDRDILIEEIDLRISGDPIKPQRFDEIYLLNDGGNVFETLVVDTSPPYSNSDFYGLIIRVHAKQVETRALIVANLSMVKAGDKYLKDTSGNYLAKVN